jgi:hypothetical protein
MFEWIIYGLLLTASNQGAGQQQTVLRYELLLIWVQGSIAIMQTECVINIVA